MRRAPWSGRVPVDEVDARRRIREAAGRCLGRCGIEGTSLAVIAAEAGVSRPTLYAYFSNRDEIVDAAVLEATASFVGRVLDHARRFPTAAERLVEATFFCVHGIRDDPVMAVRFRRDHLTSGPINADELHFARLCLEPVVELAPELGTWIDDAAELATRVVISLLTRQSPEPRSDDEERAFIGRWLPAALGVDPPDPAGIGATAAAGPGAGQGTTRRSGGEAG